MKKAIMFGLLLLLIVAGVSAFGTFKSNREIATEKCNMLSGKVIFFGNVQQINDGDFHYESICFYRHIINGKLTPSLRYELID